MEFFVPANFSPLLILQLAALTNNAQIDSMRYRVATNSIEAVDAYGMMHIPGGSFDVLREKRTQYTETRIDCKIPPLGWLDLTNEAIQAGFYGLGVDTSVTYTFYNDHSKEPIAIVTMDNNQAFATKIVFKNTAPPMVSVSEGVVQKPGVRITPNPVSDEAVLAFHNLIPAEYRMVIFDQLGRVVMTHLERMESRHSTQLELSGLPGVCFFSS